MEKPRKLPGIRIITVSGRIGAGSTTLAASLAKKLSWRHIEGGEIFWEAVRKKTGLSAKDTHLRADEEDTLFDQKLKTILETDKHLVLETKLAAFNAQGISDIFKILVVCENKRGEDQTEIRIDRLVNRENLHVDAAKVEVLEREKNDLKKWQKLYAHGDPSWTYYNKTYYDLVINTFELSPEEALERVLQKLHIDY